MASMNTIKLLDGLGNSIRQEKAIKPQWAESITLLVFKTNYLKLQSWIIYTMSSCSHTKTFCTSNIGLYLCCKLWTTPTIYLKG